MNIPLYPAESMSTQAISSPNIKGFPIQGPWHCRCEMKEGQGKAGRKAWRRQTRDKNVQWFGNYRQKQHHAHEKLIVKIIGGNGLPPLQCQAPSSLPLPIYNPDVTSYWPGWLFRVGIRNQIGHADSAILPQTHQTSKDYVCLSLICFGLSLSPWRRSC